jgi:hypothetical protein
MKKSLFTLASLLIIFTVFTTSCDSDDPSSSDLFDGMDNSEIAVLYIKKITNGKNEFVDFTYSNINQLVEISSGTDNPMTMNYSYNDLGQMIEMNVEDVTGTNSTTVFNYDLDGNITGGTTTNEGFEAVHTYQFNQGVLESVSVFADVPFIGNTIFGKTEFTYSGDNVTEFKEYTLNFMTGSLSLSKKVSYEYDKYKNPYFDLAVQYSVISEGYEEFASKNNSIKRTVEFDNTGFDDEIGSYEISYDYNSDNYPISASDGTIFTYY